MTFLKRVAAFGAMMLASSTVALAEPKPLYDCDINTKSGWVSPKLFIFIDDAGKALALDANTVHFTDGPVRAYISYGNGRLNFRWKISGVRDDNNFQVPAMRYTAVVNKKSNAVTLTAIASGHGQQWSGRGKCKIVDQSKLPKEMR